MPLIPQQETIVQYVANSSQTQYTFAFYSPLPTDIQVFYQAPNAIPIPQSDQLTLNVDYSVTYNSDPTTGGYIALLFTATTGYYLTINRNVIPSLDTNFSNAQTFNGANLDAALDRLLLLIQQNTNYNLQRNLSFVLNSYLPNYMPYTQLPVLANMQIWQGTGNGIVAVTLEENPNVSTLRSQLAGNAPTTDGATLVGYYDVVNNNPTTVDAELQYLSTKIYFSNARLIATGTGNALVATTLTPLTTFVSGTTINIVAPGNNSGGAVTTLNLNATGAKNIIIPNIPNNPPFLPDSALLTGQFYTLIWNGTYWVLQNPSQFNYGASVLNSNVQTVAASGSNAIPYNTKTDDPNLIYSTSTFIFTPKVAGWYQVNANTQISSPVNPCNTALTIYKNGITFRQIDQAATSGSGLVDGLSGTARVFCNGSTDYLQIFITNSGSETLTLPAGEGFCDISYLGNAA